jgi:hypothetical protein
MRLLGRPHGSEFGFDLGEYPRHDTAGRTQTDIAINAWTVEIYRPLKPH